MRTSLDIAGDLPHDWFSGVSPERAMSESQQYIYPVFEQQKADLLLHLLEGNTEWGQVLVFLRTRESVHELASELNKEGIPTESLHGKQKQEVKERVRRNKTPKKGPRSKPLQHKKKKWKPKKYTR